MKVEKIIHTDVDEDGRVESGGAVTTTPTVRIGRGEGCGPENCHCSDGYWIFIGHGRNDDGIVEGTKVTFDSKEEMDLLFQNGVIEWVN